MKPVVVIPASALILLLLASITLAQGGYDLSRWTVDGGGHTFSSGGGYSLGGTVGQPDAGALRGGNYVLVGGFWGNGTMAAWKHSLYIPVVLRSH